MSLRILVVDDHAILREVVPAQLAHFGHEAKAVDSLEKTMIEIQNWQPHAVIIDLIMPGHDGFQIFDLVQSKFESPPHFVAMSGQGTSEKQRLAHDAGFDFFLRKPFKLADLARMLEQLNRAIEWEQK